eukprot:g5405.t1
MAQVSGAAAAAAATAAAAAGGGGGGGCKRQQSNRTARAVRDIVREDKPTTSGSRASVGIGPMAIVVEGGGVSQR